MLTASYSSSLIIDTVIRSHQFSFGQHTRGRKPAAIPPLGNSTSALSFRIRLPHLDSEWETQCMRTFGNDISSGVDSRSVLIPCCI